MRKRTDDKYRARTRYFGRGWAGISLEFPNAVVAFRVRGGSLIHQIRCSYIGPLYAIRGKQVIPAETSGERYRTEELEQSTRET